MVDLVTIDKPGIYKEFPAASYHADPCPEPSLSSSMAKLLINTSPLHAMTAHPKLNPDFEANDGDAKMDFGSVAHELLLKQGGGIEILNFDSFRTKAAQEARAAAKANGMTPILRHDFDRANLMVEAARAQIAYIEDCHDAFVKPGLGEQMLAWQEGDMWFRNLADYIAPARPTGHIVCYDYKTTSASASPSAVAMTLYNMEYEVQAAMLERGLVHLVGNDVAGKIIFRFVVQETTAPFALTVAEMDATAWMLGRKKLGAAVSMWRRCVSRGEWPGYPSKIIKAEMPEFMENRWLRREENPLDVASMDGDPFLWASPWTPERKKLPMTLGD